MARRKVGEFEGCCQRCGGSGLWQDRAGYTCNACGGAGKVRVAVLEQFAAAVIERIGRDARTWGFYVISAKGNVTKQRYDAVAELTADMRRFDCGQTLGGWYEFEMSAVLAGARCGVYGVSADGELIVAHNGGGYGKTGLMRHQHAGNERLCAVRVLEPAAAAAIAELCEREGVTLSEHAQASAASVG